MLLIPRYQYIDSGGILKLPYFTHKKCLSHLRALPVKCKILLPVLPQAPLRIGKCRYFSSNNLQVSKSFEPSIKISKDEMNAKELIEAQMDLIKTRPNDKHLKFDLVCLILRSLRVNISEDWDEITRLLEIVAGNLEILANSKKFFSQLKKHLDQDLDEKKQLQIVVRRKELEIQVKKHIDIHIPLYSNLIHYQLLSMEFNEAMKMVNTIKNFALSNSMFLKANELQTKEKKLTEAGVIYNDLLKINPRHSAAWTNLGIILLNKANNENPPEVLKVTKIDNSGIKDIKKLKAIIHCFTQAINFDLGKCNYWAHYYLASVYETALKNSQYAREHYSKVLEIDPNHLESHTALGSLLMDEKHYDGALEHYKIAYDLAPYNSLVYYNLASCYSHMGLVDIAVQTLDKAIVQFPNESYGHMLMGNILARVDDFSAAIQGYNKAIENFEIHQDESFDIMGAKLKLMQLHIHYVEISLPKAKTVKDFKSIAQNLDYITRNYREDEIQLGIHLTNLGFCYIKSREIELALVSFQEARSLGMDFIEFFRKQNKLDAKKSSSKNMLITLERVLNRIQFLQELLTSLEDWKRAKVSNNNNNNDIRPDYKPTGKYVSNINNYSDDDNNENNKNDKNINDSNNSENTTKENSVSVSGKKENLIKPLRKNKVLKKSKRGKYLDNKVSNSRKKCKDRISSNVSRQKRDLNEEDKLKNEEPTDEKYERVVRKLGDAYYDLSFCTFHMGELEDTIYNLTQALYYNPICNSQFVFESEPILDQSKASIRKDNDDCRKFEEEHTNKQSNTIPEEDDSHNFSSSPDPTPNSGVYYIPKKYISIINGDEKDSGIHKLMDFGIMDPYFEESILEIHEGGNSLERLVFKNGFQNEPKICSINVNSNNEKDEASDQSDSKIFDRQKNPSRYLHELEMENDFFAVNDGDEFVDSSKMFQSEEDRNAYQMVMNTARAVAEKHKKETLNIKDVPEELNLPSKGYRKPKTKRRKKIKYSILNSKRLKKGRDPEFL